MINLPKIVILTNTYPPEFGAAPLRLADLAKGLQYQGFQIEVITGMPNYPSGVIIEGYRRSFFRKDCVGNICVRRHWMYTSPHDSKVTRLLRMLSLAVTSLHSFAYIIKYKPDYILVQCPPPALMLVAFTLRFFTKAKLLLNVSDLWPGAMVDLAIITEGSISHRILNKLFNTFYRKADCCLVQSEEIKTYIEKIASTPIYIYRTGANANLFRPAPPRTRKRHTLCLVYVGILGIAHGLYNVCRTINFNELNASLTLVGDGSEKNEISKWLQIHRNRGIILAPPVDNREVAGLLHNHDVAFIAQKTKIYGTLPSKIYEAMMAGLPILFSGAGEGAAIIETHQCGLVTHPSDTQALKATIKQFEQMPIREREKMGSNGRRAAEIFFSREKQINNFIHFLKKDYAQNHCKPK